MAMMLKQSTAVDVLIGPFVDLTNGASAETGESPTVKLSKNGQTLAAKSDVTTPTHDADGYYNCELDATDTNTVGTLTLTVAASATALPVRHEFQVVAANVYDSLYAASGTDTLQVETTTNSDKTGYTISGTKTTLDALNDVAATDIVSGGAITTSSGAVSNVTTVATTTTNTDMRGTDGAYTGTPPTAAAISDAVWDEALSGHTVSGSTGKTLNQLKEGIISIDGSVNDASATSATFVTNLTASTSGFYHDKVLVFVSGTLNGQARHIETYNGTTKSITVSQAFTSAPGNGDEFLILATHEHSLNEIADAVLDEVLSGHTTAGTLGKAVADIEADTNELQSDDVPGLIAALNDISAAQVNAEVDTALADYDAPTKAELDAGLAALNDLSTTDILGMAYESTEDFQDFLRLTRAVLLGKTTGAGTGTENFRDRADGKNRVVSTIDSNGDRTAIATDAT